MIADLTLILQLFVLLNPMSSFPFLLAAHEGKLNVRLVAVKSVATAFIIALIITLIGPSLFNVFGIDIDSLRIAGGVILLLLGINMVKPKKEKISEPNKVNSLISIIATPLLTGPATISFITVKAYEIGKMAILLDLCLAFLLVGAVFIIFSFAIKKINPTIIDLLSRVMGLFLTAVAIEMISKGIEGTIRAVI